MTAPKRRWLLLVAIAALAAVYSLWCFGEVLLFERSPPDALRYVGQAFVAAWIALVGMTIGLLQLSG